MKVKGALGVIVGLLAVSWVSAQAPYAPSGYRPPGRQFSLPRRPAANQGFGSGLQPQNQFGAPQNPPQNQYGAPQNPPPNQYGAPINNPQNTVTPPPDQYLPGLAPTDLRFNFGQTNRQQQNSLGQNEQSFSSQQGQRQYGVPGQNQQQGSSDQQFGFSGQNRQQGALDQQQYGYPSQNVQPGQQQLNQNRQQIYRQQQGDVSQSKNVEQQSFVGQGFSDQSQGFGTTNTNNQQRPLPRPTPSGRNYLAPRENNLQQQSQFENANQQNVGQNQAARQQLYQIPSKQSNDDEFVQNDDHTLGGNENVNVANQNYLPPTTTERRRYPEPTTRRPETREAEPEDDEAEDPNVAIATAVARGQYYLLQPNGQLQRVLYKTTQTKEDLVNNAVSAKLVYQAVQPITAPIYTYSAPLVRYA